MSILFIGKRFYTNRDALREKYGRIYQLPWHWAKAGIPTRLWLVDYHTRETVDTRDGNLAIASTPVKNPAVFWRWWAASHSKRNRPNVVVASGDCYVGLMAYRIAKRLRARFVFDVYDKYDEFDGYRRLPGFDPLHFLLRHAHARLFASAALLNDLSSNGQNNILVPNGVDQTHFAPMARDACREQLGLQQDIPMIGYFGSMTADRGVEDLISAVAVLRNSGLRIELILAGHRALDQKWTEAWIHDFDNLSYAHIATAMACCDVLALPYRRSAYLDAASSCKIAEYIAMQRPIAATDTPNLRVNFPEQVRQLGSFIAAPQDVSDLARVVAEQLKYKRLVSLPRGYAWGDIAAATIHRIESSC